MPSLSQSPLLQALGYAIANSLWQMALVWIVYVLLNSIFKFRSETKFRIAVAAQVTGFSWFLVTLQFYYRQCSQALELAASMYLESSDQSTYVVATEKGSLLSYFLQAEQVLPYLSVAYLLLLAFLIIRWFRAYRYTQLVRLNGLHKIDIDWKLFVAKVAGQLGIKQKVRIFLSEIVQSPVTIGFLKPVILIPIASINHLTLPQLEAIILHELAHIRRHDYLLNILLSVIDLGLFFNPFTRLITKSISNERENSCDDWVLQYQYNPSMYAEALLRIAVLQKTPQMAMHAVKSKGELLSRVHRMVHQKDSRFNYRHQLIALLLMTGILSSVAWFDPSKIKAQDAKSYDAKQAVVLEPLPARVDNPLFNPMFFLNESLKEEVQETVAKANEKHISRLKKELRTEGRQIILPRVLAPVAIENMSGLEKKIALVNKDLKRTLMQMPGQMKLAQNHLFHFDSLHFKGNFNFPNAEMADFYSQGTAAEMHNLEKAQQALEEALKNGKISKAAAKKLQAEITNALKSLKDIKLPQLFGFAPGADHELFYRNGANWFEEEEQKNKKITDEKKRINHAEIRGSNIRMRKDADSIRNKLIVKTTIKAPRQPEVHAYMAIADGARYVIADTKTEGQVKSIPFTGLRTVVIPKVNTQDQLTYTYAYTESGDECEEANRNERTRRIAYGTSGPSKNKATSPSSKTKKKTTTGTCTTGAHATTVTKEKEAETLLIEVQMQ